MQENQQHGDNRGYQDGALPRPTQESKSLLGSETGGSKIVKLGELPHVQATVSKPDQASSGRLRMI